MTQDEIIAMARQAGFLYGVMGPSETRFVTAIGHTFTVELEAFAKLVAAKYDPKIAIADAYRAGVDSGIAAEREACAKVCDAESADIYNADYYNEAARVCAAKIRARGATT